VLNQRSTDRANADAVLKALGPSQASATAKPSNATRVIVQVSLPKGRRIQAQAVILLLDDAKDPYRVLSWTDDFDG
jgi:general secretion pathway protein K